MARSVREAVQDDVAVAPAIDDFRLSIRKFGQFAENAAFRFAVILARRADLRVTPGRPEIIHDLAE